MRRNTVFIHMMNTDIKLILINPQTVIIYATFRANSPAVSKNMILKTKEKQIKHVHKR